MYNMKLSSLVHIFLLQFLLFALGEGFAVHRTNNNIVDFSLLKLAAENQQETSSYDETGGSSKGVVSALTDLVNFFFPDEVQEKLGKQAGMLQRLLVTKKHIRFTHIITTTYTTIRPPTIASITNGNDVAHSRRLCQAKLSMDWRY